MKKDKTQNQDKVMIITGASSGIGKATAIKAAASGIKVVLTARRKKLLDELVSTIGEDKALAVTADITSMKEAKKVVKAALDKWGRLDVVFANAGTGLSKAGTENGDPEEWDKLVDVNIKGLLWTAHASLPELKKTKGHFILTSSVAGKIALKGSIYGASKWFATGFGQNLAKEMEAWEGRCTTICPGMVNTPFFDEAKPKKLDPMDVAEAVVYAVNASPRNNIREITLLPTHMG
jgi:NADP-dependent 3-hydroxy acid dehydrogenase YdfG